ncbi:fructosamine kinase family protein [Rhodobacteraceae bacterium DSL-40]|uniref:fructosamine kinase family protein n=1 Tax=Amaricoccus sp. B4 TaxID=3368557 RepID=UPI000DAD20D3
MSAASEAAALLGSPLRRTARLHGGDLSEVLALELVDGREVIAKPGPTARAEARMLRAIRAAGAPAPEILAEDDGLLVLELLPDDGTLGEAWASLGAVLARLHAARGAGYGWPEDHRFGSVAIPNRALDSWPEFWAERRLLPALPHLPAPLARRVERLAGRLGDLLPRAPAPALLHGDLWSGNVLVSGGAVSGLIDPACYHGDGEVDLAMLALFSAQGPEFRAAYGPEEPGFAARQPVYQLWPALVHLRLFGAGYAGMVDRLLRAAGC